MGRLLRFLFGVALVLVGLALTLQFGHPAYLSLPGRPVDVTIVGPCQTDRFLTVDKASRCGGRWTDVGVPHRGDVVAAKALATGSTVRGKAFDIAAYVPPTGTELLLGYASVPLVLIGLYIALKRRKRHRRRVSGRGGRSSSSGHRGDHDDDDDDYDSSDGGDGGGDSGSGGDSGGGGDGGGGGGD